jgi:uncharacterized membrane protein (DUF4010 family)
VLLAAASGGEAGRLVLALGIGLLLGVERERRKGRGPGRGPAGIRTFALVALLGGLAWQTGEEAVVAVSAGFVGLATVVAFAQRDPDHPGMTTEIALMVTFLLGALAQDDPALASGLAVAVAIVLAYRDRLHRLVRDTLTEDEVHDGLLFAAAALIVLPLLPDEGVGPHDALTPFTVWRLVVLIMAIQGLGYVALRILGPRYGLLLSGFAGGFVSSTATIGAMGARAKEQPRLTRAAVGAAVASTVGTFVLMAIVLAATSVETVEAAALPLVAGGLAATAWAAAVSWRVLHEPASPVDPGRAFDLRTPVLLAVTVSVVLVAAAVLQDALGPRGVTLGAGLGGFADSQSAGVSAASLVDSGRLSAADATIPVLAALSTNTVSKAGVAIALGTGTYARSVVAGLAVVLGATWAAYLAISV